MRNNPYHKNLKEHLPLFMQGPRSISALISNEGQKNVLEKAKQLPNPKMYSVRNVSFAMVSPPVLNKDLIFNPTIEMGQTEVTQELFQAVMGWNDSRDKSHLQNPVENVTWYDCTSFCNKLSNLLGFEECYEITDIKKNVDFITEEETNLIIQAKVTWDESKNGFRLPTEYEWEIFAKAGTNNQWSGTNYESNLDQYAWYQKNSGYGTHPVGEKLPNEWGLYDMSGNVYEWCWDFYDPTKPTKGRIVRGGSCGEYAYTCTVAYRRMFDADFRNYNQGLRLLRSLG